MFKITVLPALICPFIALPSSRDTMNTGTVTDAPDAPAAIPTGPPATLLTITTATAPAS